MPFYNSDLTNNLLPTVVQIRKYVRIANAAEKRDVRYLMSFLQRLMEVDSYLMGLVQSRKRGCRGFKFDIRMPLEFKMSSQDEIRLQETKTRFRRAGLINVLDDILDGILFGVSAVRLVYDNTKFGTMPVKLIPYDLTSLDFSDNTDLLSEIITDTKTGIFSKIDLDPDIHIQVKYNPIKNRKNYIGSYMRTIMLLSYLKYQNNWNWADLNERHGIPPTYATHPEGMEDDQIQKLIGMVEKLRKDSAAVFPESVKILYEQALKGDSTDSFEKFLVSVNKEMAICLHGQNLTTEVAQGGSKAAAQVHNAIDDLIIAGDLEIIQDVLTNQYLKQDYLLNYGEPGNDSFEFVVLREEQQDYESNSRIIANIFSDPNIKSALPIKKTELYEKLGFTQPNPDDEII